MSVQQHLEIITMMERFELNIHNLYNLFAHKFPRLRQFWADLALEEKSHAYMLELFGNMLREGDIIADSRPFKTDEIRVCLEKINSDLDRVMKSSISQIEAIHMAIDIESSMLESKMFEMYHDDSEDLKRILVALQDDTRRHFNKLLEQRETIAESE